VTLTSGSVPLNNGAPLGCHFDCDASGNNTVDFGFFNPNAPLPCPPKLDNSGAVNVSDILIVVGEYGCVNACTADLNGDGYVGVADVLMVLPQFGKPCE